MLRYGNTTPWASLSPIYASSVWEKLHTFMYYIIYGHSPWYSISYSVSVWFFWLFLFLFFSIYRYSQVWDNSLSLWLSLARGLSLSLPPPSFSNKLPQTVSFSIVFMQYKFTYLNPYLYPTLFLISSVILLAEYLLQRPNSNSPSF